MKLLPLLYLEGLLPFSKKSTRYKPKTFGLEFFTEEMVSATNSWIESINRSQSLFLLSAQERELLKKRNEQLRAMQRYLAGLGPRPSQLTWDDAHQALERKILWQQWCEKKAAQFNTLSYWDDLPKSFHHSPLSEMKTEKINQLQTQWFSQYRVALHSHDALQEVLKNRLPPLEKHYENAQRELYARKSKMPESFYQACDAALIKFQSSAARLKQQAAASCLTRLEAWDRTGGQCSQPVFYFAEQIASVSSQANLLKGDNALPQEKMTSTQLQFFISTLLRFGTQEQKLRLQKISGFKPGSWLPLSVVQTPSSVQVVPHRLVRQIPQTQPWPAWLWREKSWLCSFFQNKSVELVQLNQRTSFVAWLLTPEKLKSIDALLQDWNQKDALLNRWQQECVEQTPFFLFQSRKKQFLREWRETLTEYAVLHLQDHITLAEKIRSFIQTIPDSDLKTVEAFKERLNTLMQKVQQSPLLTQNPPLQLRYQELLKPTPTTTRANCEVTSPTDDKNKKLNKSQKKKTKSLFLNYLNQLTHLSLQQNPADIEKIVQPLEAELIKSEEAFHLSGKSLPEMIQSFQRLRANQELSLLRVEARSLRRVFIQHQLNQSFQKDLHYCEEQLQYFEQTQRWEHIKPLGQLSTYAKSLAEQLKVSTKDSEHLEIYRTLSDAAKQCLAAAPASNTSFFGKTKSQKHILFTRIDRLYPEAETKTMPLIPTL